MKAAITTLEIALHNLETNEPIHREEGKMWQAEMNRRDASQIRFALRILTAIERGGESGLTTASTVSAPE